MTTKAIRVLFAVAALYDGLLGLAFLIAGESLFERFGVTPPNHWGYIQFPALLLITFGLMFWQIANDPGRNRNLIPYGVGLKVSYCAVVFYHWLGAGIPPLWKPFAVADLAFAVLFVWAYLALAQPGSCQTHELIPRQVAAGGRREAAGLREIRRQPKARPYVRYRRRWR